MSHRETIDAIRAFHRERCFAMEQRKRSDLALGAFLRTQLGWRKDLDAATRKAIATKAAAIADGADDPDGERWRAVVLASVGARAPFDRIEAEALKEMARLAKALPVWATFGEGVRGFGAASLAVIVAEAGDLSLYPDHSKLWKRMGLAVFDGLRQGGLRKNANKDDWIAHGYNRSRRSRMWNIGDAMIKAQVRKVKDERGEGDTDERIAIGPYGAIYLQRKASELSHNPEMTAMHAHRRAQRYLEKRLLRDLWQAWRRANWKMSHVGAIRPLPAADLQNAA
jgi:hypothetical protein